MTRTFVVLCALAVGASADVALSANGSIPLPHARPEGATVPAQVDQARANWTLAIVDHLRAQTSYPELARLFGSEGVVLLYFVIDRKGAVHDLRVLRSSGNLLLDGRSLRLLREAQPLPPPPGELPGDRFPITLPLRYRLQP
jgi:protein TonB